MLTIYGVPLSQPVRAVVWACLIKRVPFDFQVIVPGAKIPKRGGQSPEYLAINPTGTVPCIDDNGVVVFESNAILTYLAHRYNWTDLYPQDPAKRACVDQYLHWHHRNTREFSGLVSPKFRPDLVFPPGFKEQVSKGIAKSMRILDGWLSSQQYVAGESLTLADIALFQEVSQLAPEFGNLYDFQPYPGLQKWLETMKQVPYYSEITEASKLVGDLSGDVAMATLMSSNKKSIKTFSALGKSFSKL
eukprot:m.265057 g.265057  ORF g.265057 m.265057 type:complete len:246 (-) comp59625_c0_seq1:52-789(-)